METDEASNQASEQQGTSEAETDDRITVGQRIDRICSAANIALNGSREVSNEVRQLLDIHGRVNRSPYAMMAAAAGTGYILSGGLFSPLTARILNLSFRVGVRLAAASPLIQSTLRGFADAAPDNDHGSNVRRYAVQPSKVMQQGSCYDEPKSSKTRR